MYRGAQTTTLLRGEGERGENKADRVNCPKNFVLHCRQGSPNVLTRIVVASLKTW